jgi:hypothetical protein
MAPEHMKKIGSLLKTASRNSLNDRESVKQMGKWELAGETRVLTQRKRALVSLYPSQILQDMIWDRTQSDTIEKLTNHLGYATAINCASVVLSPRILAQTEHSSIDSLTGERGCRICELWNTQYNRRKILHSLFRTLDRGIKDFPASTGLEWTSKGRDGKLLGRRVVSSQRDVCNSEVI